MEQTFIEKIVQDYSNGLFYYFSRITKKNRILKNSCSTRRRKISSSGRGEKGEREKEGEKSPRRKEKKKSRRKRDSHENGEGG